MAVHNLLVEFLQQVFAPPGGRFELCHESVRATSEPWLCFLRRARGDVLYVPPENHDLSPFPPDNRFKVCGSAQRRCGRAVLQHGGLILQRSAAAPEILGLTELSSKLAKSDEIVAIWLERMARSLGLEGNGVGATDELLSAEAERVARQKFERPEWNLRR